MRERVKLRRAKSGNDYIWCAVGVPAHIARHIPKDAVFDVELTEEGLLYRLVTEPEVGLPSWAKREEGEVSGG